MIILTNCLTEKADEGCLKVANSLVRRILKKKPDVAIITYERKPEFETLHLSLNKLLLNARLFKVLREKNEPVLYIPFPAKEWATALRVFFLSCACRKRVTVLFTMLCRCRWLGRILFMLSGAKLVTLSRDTVLTYEKMVGNKRVIYLKTGVDTEKFSPISLAQKLSLRKKYGIDPDQPVVLHVGHLKAGRNIVELMKLDSCYQVLLVVSTLTQNQQDENLRKTLLQCPNIRIIDTYIPNIEELYQLSDVYFFPVVAKGNCIDIPLSCMEAASCNKPVITTTYGEMATFQGRNGFYFVDNFEKKYLNEVLAEALHQEVVYSREAVLEYDWSNALATLEV